MKYDIYIEGYNITGNQGKAKLLYRGFEAKTFKDACTGFAKTEHASGLGIFCEESLSFWGCRLYSSIEEARETFG